MSIMGTLLKALGYANLQEGADASSTELRGCVHRHRNVATESIHQSREAVKVSQRSTLVTEEAIRTLEATRDM